MGCDCWVRSEWYAYNGSGMEFNHIMRMHGCPLRLCVYVNWWRKGISSRRREAERSSAHGLTNVPRGWIRWMCVCMQQVMCLIAIANQFLKAIKCRFLRSHIALRFGIQLTWPRFHWPLCARSGGAKPNWLPNVLPRRVMIGWLANTFPPFACIMFYIGWWNTCV